MNLQEMSYSELAEHKALVEAKMDAKKEEEKASVIEEMKAFAKDKGFDFDELTGGKKQRKKISPKYKHPENPSLTWTGMGRKPKWLVEAVESGKSLDDFKI